MNNLKALRDEYGLRQEDFAARPAIKKAALRNDPKSGGIIARILRHAAHSAAAFDFSPCGGISA